MAEDGKRVALLLLSASLVCAQAPAPLQLNLPLTDRIAGGQSRQYQIDLRAGQFLEAVVEQKGIDVVVRLIGPTGNKLLEIDSPNGDQGPESVYWIAQTGGPHRLEVAAGDPAAKPGDYQVSVLRLEEPSQNDQLCAEADRVYSEAGLLRVQAGTEAQRRSRDAYDHAARIFSSAGRVRDEVYALTLGADAAHTAGDINSYLAVLERLLQGQRQLQDRPAEATTMHRIGRNYFDLNQFEKAIGYYQEALTIQREVKDRRGEGTTLSSIGFAYDTLNQYEKAIGHYQEALAIWREVKDRKDEGQTLHNIGHAYIELSQQEKAIAYLEQSLVIARERKDRRGEGSNLNGLGVAYSSLNQFEKAIGYYQQSLAIQREAKDRGGEGSTLGNIGVAYGYLSRQEKAIEYLEEALVIARERKDRRSEADILNNIGAAYEALGQAGMAIDHFQQALALRREVNDRRGEGRSLGHLGGVYQDLGQTEKAIGYYQQALAIARELNDRSNEAGMLNNIGGAYGHLSQYEKAIGYLEQALISERELKDRRGEGFVLGNLGVNYSDLGQYEKGVEYYQQALAIARDIKNRQSEGAALHNLGTNYIDLRQFDKSLGYLEQSLGIFREIKDREGEGEALGSIGTVYDNLNQTVKAIEYHEQALAVLREVKDRRGEGQALHNIGAGYINLGQYERSVDYLNQALAIAREVKDRRFEAFALESLGKAWGWLHRSRLAIFYGKEAINTIQSIRGDIGGLTKEVQEGYAKTKESTYRGLADLLIAMGRLPEAQQVLNLLKEEEYFQFVRRDQAEAGALTGRADLTSDEADWAKRYREVSDRLTAIGARYGELRALRNRTAEQQEEITRLEGDLAAGNRAFRQFLGGLNEHFSAKVSQSGGLGVAELRDAQALERTLRELRHGAVAIYTLTGEDRYRAILVTPTLQRAYEYPIKSADLNRKIQAFRELVQNPRSDPRRLAEDLYHILIPPALADDLRQAKAETLMWYLDGTLRYLPLAALYDGKSWLIEQYRLAVFTPASKAELKDEPARSNWKLLGLGVTKSHESFAALPNVAGELGGIVRPAEDEELLDESFTSAAMRTQLDQGYPLVHIATHFRFQAGDDSQSYLLLGDGSHLSVAEAKDIPELFRGVELLTLSACNTGMGDAAGDGSEVEGFGVVAQREGAKAVIATLWPVADQSTSLLMQEFYRGLESTPPMLKSEALRVAQLALLHGTMKQETNAAGARGVSVPAQRAAEPAFNGFTHPYFWAPFFLMGNWL